MKYIVLFLIFGLSLFGGVLKSSILSINTQKTEATIQIEQVDVGVSGFIVHKIAEGRTVILNNAVVTKFDKNSKTATLALSEYTALVNNSLPNGRWQINVGDEAVLAFGYSRGLLIAPSEEIYYRVTKHSKLQWIHPDIFATILSFNGHPTPLREDFTKLSISSSVGLVYIYLDKKLYTVDTKSFKIIAVIDADLKEGKVKLPFYTRIQEIDANWFGEGSNEIKEYEPYYYKLLAQANPNNKKLYKMLKNSTNKRVRELVEIFNNGE